MSWEVVWTTPALRDMGRLDRQVAARVHAAVARFAETQQGSVTRLQGVDPPEWRLRVGDWRVRFQYDYRAHSINVLRVLPRGRAYRD